MSDMMTMTQAASPLEMETAQGDLAGGAPQPTGMGGADVSGSPNGNGDMQAMFERVARPLVENLMGEGRQNIVRVLKSTPDVGGNGGSVLGKMLISQLGNARSQGGRTIPPPVMGQTAIQVANVMADIGVQEQIIPEDAANDVAEDIFYNGLADMAEGAPEDLIPPEEMQQYEMMINELVGAEEGAGRRNGNGENGDSGGMGMNAGVGDGMGASNMSMAIQSAPGAPTEDASIMNAGRFDGNPNGGSLNG